MYRSCVRVNVRTNDETDEAAHATTKLKVTTATRVGVMYNVRNSIADLENQ